MAQRLKRLPAMWETWVRSLSWEDPLEKEIATHSSILAWRITWMEEAGRLQSMGSQKLDTTKWLNWTELVAQMVKNPPAMWETWVRSLGWEDPLEEDMATHSSILAWRIPWTEEPGELQSIGSERVGHDWATFTGSVKLTHEINHYNYWGSICHISSINIR